MTKLTTGKKYNNIERERKESVVRDLEQETFKKCKTYTRQDKCKDIEIVVRFFYLLLFY